MKRSKLFSAIIVSIIICLISSATFAHSGRTDSSGGHRDNKNASGLGYYHYHHGYGAHLHPNGVCPYDSSNSSNSSSSSSSGSSSPYTKAEPTKPKIGIVGTDIRIFIDGNEIPTFLYNGDSQCAVVIAEDLKDYGFDTSWDNNTKTLTILKNTEKAATPIAMGSYRSISKGQFLFGISSTSVNVILKNEQSGGSYSPMQIYSIDGYTLISVDELKSVGEYTWNGELKIGDLRTR